MRMVLYSRVSTADQESSGLSVDAQARALTEWCAAKGHHIVSHEHDTASGKSMKGREGLTRALNIVETGADGLVVMRLDRLVRSMSDFCVLVDDFAASDKVLVSLNENIDMSTSSGRLMSRILVSFAEYERELISQRTREAIAERRAQGLPIGRPARVHSKGLARLLRRDREAGWSLADCADRHDVTIHDVRSLLR